MVTNLKPSAGNFWVEVEEGYILFNTFTGAGDLVDISVVEYLETVDKGERVPLINPEIVKKLIERGYLTTLNPKEELLRMKRVYDLLKHYQKLSPITGIIITYDCNAGCVYCFQRDLARERDTLTRAISFTQVDSISTYVRELVQKEPRIKPQVFLYGGEPLMTRNFEIVRYILEIFSQFDFYIITNGIELADFIPLLKKFRVGRLQITIDGPKEVHDLRRPTMDGSSSFERVLEGVNLALKEKIPVYVRVNIDKRNIGNIKEFIDSFGSNIKDNVGLLKIGPALVMPSGGNPCHHEELCTREEFNQFMLGLEKDLPIEHSAVAFPGKGILHTLIQRTDVRNTLPVFFICGATTLANLLFDPYGDVYTCFGAVGYEEHKTGSYDEAGIRFNENYHLWTNRSVFTIEECEGCRYALLCGGGCALQAHYKTGSIMKPDCPNYKEVFHTYLPYFWKKSPK